jgi:hypothetical protein
MKQEDRDELVKAELRKYLLAMHKEEASLGETLDRITDTVFHLRDAHERHFIYLLEGLFQDHIPATGNSEAEIEFLKGHREAVDENNFAVRLAISVVRGEE